MTRIIHFFTPITPVDLVHTRGECWNWKMYTSTVWRPVCLLVSITTIAGMAASAAAQDVATVDLVLQSGRSLRVALDHRIAIHQVGQTITGTLVEPIYVYDRIVLPIGSRLTGHIDQIDEPSKKKRTLAIAEGDFSPHPHAVLRFDSIVDPDGRTRRILTEVKGGTLRARPHTAKTGKNETDSDEKASHVEQAREAASAQAHAALAQAHDALAMLKDPGKKERLEEFGINELPYHPQYLAKGMVYDVELREPLDFGQVVLAAPAPPGSLPAPDSVLTAKLATTIDSSKTPRGTPIEAVLSQPVFSSSHQLILPEGTRLTGEVTQSKAARYWHHNGQLRVLFDRSRPRHRRPSRCADRCMPWTPGPATPSRWMKKAERRLRTRRHDSSRPRWPVLAVRGSVHQDHELDNDDPGQAAHFVTHNGNPGAKAVGGLFGFAGIGAVAAQFSRPVAIGLSVVGASRTIYRNVIGKGREVTFGADTPIQVRLAPGAPQKPGQSQIQK